jgi:tRNA/rRNA methyltransferase
MGLRNIRIVLVRPRGAANLGATARAMKNMGLHELVLVQPTPAVLGVVQAAASEPTAGRPPADAASYWASALAVHADDVLRQARCCPSLDEAVGDCGVVVGTTCRDGLYRAAVETPRAAAPALVAAAAANRVALVFGPEDHGLSNEDLKACHRLIAIPSDPGYPSLNLAQAVMVCCYELFTAADTAANALPALATAERVTRMLDHLQAALLSIGFLHADNPDHIMFAFRRLFGRAQLEERDVRILLGLARQIEWYGSEGWRADPQHRLPPGPLPEGEAEEADIPN